MNKHTNTDLKQMQSLPLEAKIEATKRRIRDWYEYYNGEVYVSFSGGKDSTVLLDIVRKIDNSILAVFCNTGLEYPEIVNFVRSINNVHELHPIKYDRKKRKWVRTSYTEVIEQYGYPVISKEQSAFIQEYRDTKSDKLKNTRWNGNKYNRGKISDKWKYLVNAPFKISDKCCDVMKKKPAYVFEKETGLHPIIGTTAEESNQRRSNWLMYGCNAFEKKRPTSNPLSFWTEQDILQYIKEFIVPITKQKWNEAKYSHGSVRKKARKYLRKNNYNKTGFSAIYGEIVEDENGKLKCTGEPRSGCFVCMFGCHLEKEPNKFQRMKISHPRLHNYCINGCKQGEVLDYIGVKYD